MKIVWINEHAMFVGGAETYIYETAQELDKKYKVENILLYNPDNRIEHKYVQAFSFTTVLANLEEQLKQIQADIVYVHQVKDLNILHRLSQLDVPVVAFIHDHKYFCLREHKYTTIGNKTCTQTIGANCYICLGFINKSRTFPYMHLNSVRSLTSVHKILQNFDQVIVASDYMKSHLIQHNFEENKISKIALFSKEERLVTPTEIKTNEKRFLFVGQLVKGKGIDTLLNAFSQINVEEVYLDICGSGNEKDALEKQAEKLGIVSKIRFHGKIHFHDLSNFYSNAYAVVVPSRAPETFNLVGIEAMKHGKAVIASQVGGIQEWLREDETGFSFPSNETKILGSLLNSALKNPKKIQEMGLQGLSDYQNKFTPSKHCHTLYTKLKTLSTPEKDKHVS